MRLRYFLTSIFSLTIFIIIGAFSAACAKPPSTPVQIDSPGDVPEALVKSVKAEGEDGFDISLTPDMPVPQATPLYEGQSLLESHCTQCHLANSIVGMKKSRTEWEKILEQMEMMGAHLEEPEKSILLDYLTATDKP